MKVAVSGASGLVGHAVVGALIAAGHQITVLGRPPVVRPDLPALPFDLGAPSPDLVGQGALVHLAFAHLPGLYRGGEGDDPEGFRHRNLGGSIALFEAARAAGVGRILFLSSRAVYGAYPPGTALTETLEPRPDTLYGAVKHQAEQALAALSGPGLAVASLRATGIYGPPVPGLGHKWQELFARYAAGEALAPRISTELHADDLAAAVTLLLDAPAEALAPAVFNASDFVLDRRHLLETLTAAGGPAGLLPPSGDPASVSAMDTGRLRALGWRPRGPAALADVLRACLLAPVLDASHPAR